ncbi:MAG: hypothetical protein IPO17_13910 [Flavobacteriales bacterium]|nr:hypothetical protein [Flavobacteriales bacterium]
MPIGVLIRDAVDVVNMSLISELGIATMNTLHVGAWAAAITLLIALVLAWSERFAKGNVARSSWLARLGYVVPGAVIAVGVMGLAGGLDKQLVTMGITGRLMLIGTLPCLYMRSACGSSRSPPNPSMLALHNNP